MGIKFNGDSGLLYKTLSFNSNTPLTVYLDGSGWTTGGATGIIFTNAEVLWTNSNPTSALANSTSAFASFSFGAKGMYDFFLIEFANWRSWGSQYAIMYTGCVAQGVGASASTRQVQNFALWSGENAQTKSRQLQFTFQKTSTTNVDVSVASIASYDGNNSSAPQLNTSVCVPRTIYGVLL